MAKAPSFPFYAEDWLSDEKLRACSSAARGLWIDMLSLMHKNDRRGYLQLAGKPVTPEQLARMTGRSTDETSQQLAELLNAGVPSATDDGILFSRRMTRDERKRQLCAEAGLRGGRPKGSGKGECKGPLGKGKGEGASGFFENGKNSEEERALCKAPARPDAAELTVAWRFWCKATAPSQFDLDKLDGFFGALLDQGFSKDRILGLISDQARPKTEPTWEFEKRLKGGSNGQAKATAGSKHWHARYRG